MVSGQHQHPHRRFFVLQRPSSAKPSPAFLPFSFLMTTTRALLNLSSFLRIGGALLVVYVAFVVFVFLRQRSMLFFPSHSPPFTSLAPWSDGRATIGYCREVPSPRAIWLMTHGNAGQAADRSFVLQR